MSGLLLATLTLSIVFALAYPLILAGLAASRLRAGWRFFAFGALIFVVFQLLLRTPILGLIQARLASSPPSSPALQLGWLVLLALTAGIFEEGGRYLGYLWLFKPGQRTWQNAIMYGAGHGGIEAMLLLGLINLGSLVSLIGGAAQGGAATSQAAALSAWMPLVGAYERLWAVPVQVGFSVLVLQVFRRRSAGWLLLAICAHAVIDFLGAGIVPTLGLAEPAVLVLSEGITTVAGLIALWWIARSRRLRAAVPMPA